MATTNTIRKATGLRAKATKKSCGCRGDCDCSCGCKGSCDCPACQGLECLERPRFFAGQLLTEADFNAAQAYSLAKNRLHNRYLHGWGVVCGLEVVCHPCPGWVTVRSGYAIDPCGNDIIVCQNDDLHLLEKIRECRAALRPRKECNPDDPRQSAVCDEMEEHWCITVKYREKEARPITVLRPDPTGSCGCGCGGGSGNGAGDCGCGCHSAGSTRSKTVSRPATRRSSTIGECEPTRIFETYELGVKERCPECEGNLRIDRLSGRQSRSVEFIGTLNLPANIRPIALLAVVTAPDSLLTRIIVCLQCLLEKMRLRLSQADLALLGQFFSFCRRFKPGSDVNPPAVDANLFDFCCRLERLIAELKQSAAATYRCTATCPACAAAQSQEDVTPGAAPGAAAGSIESICCLINEFLRIAVDCFCHALLPPCPEPPCDDRLILACVTVRGDRIIDICNFSCRHYAGGFPSLKYWASIVPIAPLIGLLLQRLCCAPVQTVDAALGPTLGRRRGVEFGRAAPTSRGFTAGPAIETINTTLRRVFSEVDFDQLISGITRPEPTPASEELERLKRDLEAMREELSELRKQHREPPSDG